MIIKENVIELKTLFNLKTYFKEKKICFFDIETTGFSREKNKIYLIGIVVFENNCYRTIQWLDDINTSEADIIKSFLEYISKYDVIINFNGNSFDIPFIQARAKKYGLNFDMKNIVSFDIYKEIKKYKKFLGLENLKQKSIELFLKINRDDKFDGGKLIEVYFEYIKYNSDKLLQLLLLHNYDDICGLVEICDIFSYIEMINGNFIVKSFQYENNLIINCELENKLKVPFSLRNNDFYISAGGNTLKLLINITPGTMKFFYVDYKNYYFLPDEDMAIHKSVAQFVDKSHKIKATKKNCYTKKTGKFIKQYNNVIQPFFKENYEDKFSFFEIDNITDEKELYCYICNLLSNLLL